MRRLYRLSRIFSAVILFFFCWTYLPLFQAVAYAVTSKSSRPRADLQKQRNERQTHGERFEKALDSIRKNADKAGDKEAKGRDVSPEVEEIKKGKLEIQELDAELQREFAETEQQIKDAKLPAEILDRHHKFVKHYKDNVAQLKAEIDDVDKAKTRADRTAKIQRLKMHAEKVKPPKKHVPLDPNNLPHRTVKAKDRAPRLKKEEFEREFGTQKNKHLAANQLGLPPIEALRTSRSSFARKPILLAYNSAIASDMPLATSMSSSGMDPGPWTALSELPAFALNPQAGILTLAAADLPTEADLAETVEVQFTPEIRAKAQELGYNPVKIYEWVRNNIEFVPTYGSIQGAQVTLETGQGNAFDTTSLLISLLRASNVPARYVIGTVEIPIEKVMNWMGGFSDPKSALNFIASNGIPVNGITAGGKVVAARIEHVWVEAWVDYLPSRGAVHRQGDTWVPLDPTFKQFFYTSPMNIGDIVSTDFTGLTAQLRDTAINGDGGNSFTGVNASLLNQAAASAKAEFLNYVNGHRELRVCDVTGGKKIIEQSLQILPNTLPYKVVVAGVRLTVLNDAKRHFITLQIVDDFFSSSLTYRASTVQLANKRITLSYHPSRSSDVQVVRSYGGLLKAPAYLTNVQPVLKIDGLNQAAGSSISLGSSQTMNITLTSPNLGSDTVTNTITAGDYQALVLNWGHISEKELERQKTLLETLKGKIGTDQQIVADDFIGGTLSFTGLSYWLQLRMASGIMSNAKQVATTHLLSEGVVAQSVATSYIFGMPSRVSDAGLNIDIDRDVTVSISKEGNTQNATDYTYISGYLGSGMEHRIFEQLYQVPGISAVKILSEANARAIPIFKITAQNVNTVLPLLSVSGSVRADIVNGINAGKEIVIPKTELVINNWRGSGYIVLDPTNGAAAYMISGGLAGGHTTTPTWLQNLQNFLSYGVGISDDFFGALATVPQAGVNNTTLGSWLGGLGFLAIIAVAAIDGVNAYNAGLRGWDLALYSALSFLLNLLADMLIMQLFTFLFANIFVFSFGGIFVALAAIAFAALITYFVSMLLAEVLALMTAVVTRTRRIVAKLQKLVNDWSPQFYMPGYGFIS